MENFQDIIFIWIRTYRGIFQIGMSVPLTTDHEVHITYYNQWISSNFCWKCAKKSMYIRYVYWKLKTFELWNKSNQVNYSGDHN